MSTFCVEFRSQTASESYLTNNSMPRRRLGAAILAFAASFFLLLAQLNVGLSQQENSKEHKLEACQISAKHRRSGFSFAEEDVFGGGWSDEVVVNKTYNFMISPKDAEGRRMDYNCSPPMTAWHVTLSSADGMVHQAAELLMHLPHEGFHMARYRLLHAGSYTLTVFLVTSAAVDFLSSPRTANPKQIGMTVVAVRNVTAVLPTEAPASGSSEEGPLPLCTLAALSHSQNAGRWVGNRWHPHDCRMPHISPDSARQCLSGKRLLFVGDAQQAALFSEALTFLAASPSRCQHVGRLLRQKGRALRLRCGKSRAGEEVPWLAGTEGRQLAVHHTQFGPSTTATFVGSLGSGFAVARVPVAANASAFCPLGDFESCHSAVVPAARLGEHPFAAREVLDVQGMLAASLGGKEGAVQAGWGVEARRRGRALADHSGAILLQLITQVNASQPLIADWMVEAQRPGLLANELYPFDHVVVLPGMHNLAVFDTPEQFAEALETVLLPSIRVAAGRPLSSKGFPGRPSSSSLRPPSTTAAWVGTWLPQQQRLRPSRQRLYNHVRAVAFEEASRRVAWEWGVPFLSTFPLTSCRPDLALGATQYSRHVSLAVIEALLAEWCPPQGQEEGEGGGVREGGREGEGTGRRMAEDQEDC